MKNLQRTHCGYKIAQHIVSQHGAQKNIAEGGLSRIKAQTLSEGEKYKLHPKYACDDYKHRRGYIIVKRAENIAGKQMLHGACVAAGRTPDPEAGVKKALRQQRSQCADIPRKNNAQQSGGNGKSNNKYPQKKAFTAAGIRCNAHFYSMGSWSIQEFQKSSMRSTNPVRYIIRVISAATTEREPRTIPITAMVLLPPLALK